MAGSSMRDIKRRIRSVTSIEHITNAMKLVSSAKLRRARNIFDRTHEYLHLITDKIHDFFGSVEDIHSDYFLGAREIRRTCYIIVTSNRGLAGSYNSNIIKMAENAIKKDREHGRKDPLLVFIGGKGRAWFTKRGQEAFSEYMRPPESVSFVDMARLAKPVIALYDAGEIDEIIIIYTLFKTTLEQAAAMKRLIPFEPLESAAQSKRKEHVEYEPGEKQVLEYLVPKFAEISLYQAVVESATCEHAARRTAMQNATDNARDMIADLNLSFNRARQAAITSEITEIVSGADVVK